jgi:ribokinase
VLIVNQHEAARLLKYETTSGHSPRELADQLREQMLVAHVAVTCGADGAVLSGPAGTWFAAAPSVNVADSVGAGDAFLGALVGAWSRGQTDDDALQTAVRAAAVSVQRSGGFSSMATWDEVNAAQ